MREIKFRAWNKDNDEMVYSFDYPYHWNIGDLGLELLESDGTDYVRQEAVFMQFTGLLDKNGTEIYEGDYVKCKWGHSDWNGTVEFIEGSFCSNPENPERYPSAISECDDVEIIGNIYEHPHLLSGDSP